MSRDCGYVQKPTVDNTPEHCDGNYYDAECVIVSKKLDYLGSKEGKNVRQVFEDLLEEIDERDGRISILEEEIKKLKAKTESLKRGGSIRGVDVSCFERSVAGKKIDNLDDLLSELIYFVCKIKDCNVK